MKLKQTSEELSNVNLLIYLLVRFPEIFTVNYNILEAKFTLSFMLKIEISKAHYIRFREKFNECMAAYSEISGLNDTAPKLNKKFIKPWTLLQVTLNKEKFSFEEVNLINSLILTEFKNGVVMEIRDEGYLANEKADNEEFMEYLLSKKSVNEEENLFAFRDAGKVYVFDK